MLNLQFALSQRILLKMMFGSGSRCQPKHTSLTFLLSPNPLNWLAISFRVKATVFTISYQTPTCISPTMSCCFSALWLQPSHNGLPTVPQMFELHMHLKAYILSVSFSWNSLLPDILITGFFTWSPAGYYLLCYIISFFTWFIVFLVFARR